MKAKALVFVALLAAIVAGIMAVFFLPSRGEKVELEDLKEEAEAKFELESPEFSYGGTIPKKYTCDGENVPPPLRWRGRPEGTEAYVLIVYDPDAPMGTFYHWIAYDIPGDVSSLEGELGTSGRNDFGGIGYGGPCPPRGSTHRYFFTLFALDAKLGLGEGARLDEVLRAMRGHVLGYAETMGRYGRS